LRAACEQINTEQLNNPLTKSSCSTALRFSVDALTGAKAVKSGFEVKNALPRDVIMSRVWTNTFPLQSQLSFFFSASL
jgi:hypothetical protein